MKCNNILRITIAGIISLSGLTHVMAQMPITSAVIHEELRSPDEQDYRPCESGECEMSACDGMSCCPCPSCPKWYAYGEAVFWTRNNRAANQPLVLNNIGNVQLSTHDLDFDYQVGPRVLIGHYTDACCNEACELSYFGIYDLDSSAVVDGGQLFAPGPLGNPPFGGAFRFATTMRADYSSDLHNIELNRVKSYSCFDLLAGIRYLSLDEEFDLTAVQGALVGNYHVETDNDLYGGQIGARLRQSCGSWGLEMTGKAGIFGNDSQQKQYIHNGLILVRPNTRNGESNVAFVGDLSFTGKYQLTDNWSLRGGYNLLWIEEVALALDQLDFVVPGGGTVLNDSGGVLFHGSHVGLQANW